MSAHFTSFSFANSEYRMKATFMSGLAWCLLAVPAWGQTAAQVQELRRQVEALEKQVQHSARADGNQRVTEIGGARARPRDTELLVRIYDVSDLFQVAPPYLAEFQSDLTGARRLASDTIPAPSRAEPSANKGGGFGGAGGGMGGGGGFFAVPDSRRLPNEQQNHLFQFGGKSTAAVPSNRISTDSLIDAITSSISPSSWSAAGGSGTIAKLGNSLVISSDVGTHDKIESLLALFRQRWGTLRTISVRGYWLWLDDAQLAALLSKEEAPAEGPRAFGLVKTDAWTKALSDAQQPESRPGYRAALTCYSGQTVSTQAGSQSLVVTQIEPEVARGDTGTPQGRVAYRPLVSVVQEGAVLQITPSATYSGKYVVLDVHSRVTRLRPPAAAPAKIAAAGDGTAASPQQVVAAIDRPVLLAQRLSTTLRVPVDRPMLIGGMTLEGQPQPGEPTLYLFAIVSVQELRDDLAASKPTTPDEKPAASKD